MTETQKIHIRELTELGWTISKTPEYDIVKDCWTVWMISPDIAEARSFNGVTLAECPICPKVHLGWEWPSEVLSGDTKPMGKHAYHKTEIPRGRVGDFSKIEEEFLEAKDALQQDNPLMLVVELSDMLGAIICYMDEHHPEIGFEGLVKQAQLTNHVFQTGGRVSCGQPS